VAGAVCRILLDELLVVRDGLFVVAGDRSVVEPERPVFLALGHPVHFLERHLPPRLGIVRPAQPRRTVGRAGVGAAEVRIEIDRALVVRQRLLVLGAGGEILGERVLARRVERGCGERLALRLPVLARGRVAERAAHVLGEHRDRAENLAPIPDATACLRPEVSGFRIERAHQDVEAARAGRGRAGEDEVDPFALGDQPPRVDTDPSLAVGHELRRQRACITPGEDRDEGRPLHRDGERLLDRPLQPVDSGGVEIADEHRHRRGRRRRRPGPREPPRPGHERQHERQRGGKVLAAEPARLRLELALCIESVQRRNQLVRGSKPFRRVRLDAAGDDAVDEGGNPRVDRARGGRRVLHAVAQLIERGGAGHPDVAEHDVAKDQAERVDVGPLIGGRAARLLGRHVLQRADDLPRDRHSRRQHTGRSPLRWPARGAVGGIRSRGRGSRNPEIHDDRVPVGIEHDVLGLEVAVHDADRVSGRETVCHFPHDLERARHRELAFGPEQRRQRLPLDVRHRQVLHAALVTDVVNAHHVTMRDLAREHELALEAPLEHRAEARRGNDLGTDDLQRNREPELFVPGLVDDAHAAGAEQSLDAIAPAEGSAGRQRRDAILLEADRATLGQSGLGVGVRCG
jgi:hypothetical protein